MPLESKIANLIKERGVNLSAISRKTGIENRGEKMKRTISDECLSKVDELIVYIADNIKSDITENKMNYEDEMPKKVMALAKLISARAEWN